MRFIQYFSFLLFTSILAASCVDRDFAEPPFPVEEEINITSDQLITIQEVKDLRSAGEEFHNIAMDKYIRATVVGDDQSGNIFKTLIIQDETGGIAIIIDEVELWNRFFVGKEVFINLENMWIGDFNNLPQLGFEPVNEGIARIPAELLNDVITIGETLGAPAPAVKTIGSLTENDLNTLIRIEDVQFVTGSANALYANSSTDPPSSVNNFLEDCNGNEIIVRSSGFSSFADELTPDGKGSITAILGIFGNDLQLTIRDLEDVELNDTRCGEGVTIPEEQVISVADLIARRVADVETVIEEDIYVSGIVVSSDETGNVFKTIVVQDETGGIAILVDQFDLYQTFEIGTSVYVHLQDLFVSDFNGLPQVGYPPSSEDVKRIPENLVSNVILRGNQGFTLSPRLTTISQLDASMLNTYVVFSDIEFLENSFGDTYADGANQQSRNHTMMDCDGNELILRTSGFADFADERIPEGNGTVTGVLQIFGDTYQIFINFPQDVDFNNDRCDGSGTGGGGGGGGGSDEGFDVRFDTQQDFDVIDIDGWLNVANKGSGLWIKRSFNGNGYAEVRAFQDPDPETDAWLVSPQINTADRNTLSFITANFFFVHEGLSILYSQDFTGNIADASWNSLSATLADANSGDHTWIESGQIDLSSLGNIHIAFRYQGTSSANTSTFRLDDILIR